MTRGLGLALLLALAGCGGPTAGTVPFGLDIKVQGLTGNETLQFVVLHDTDVSGKQLTCPDVTPACVADQLTKVRLVDLTVNGSTEKAYKTPIDLAKAQSATGQAVTVPGIPPGRGYLLVVEIISGGGTAGPQRVGVGCAPVAQVVAGKNKALSTPIAVTQTNDGCNPTL